MVLFLCLICGYFKSKNWNILFFYPLSGICERKYTLPPQGRELEIPLDDWYTPVSRPKLRNIGKNVWELDLYFDRFILYPGESVEEGNVGLHLMDWSPFDKTVCGIALIDAEENVAYGKIPSVEECLSYETPNLLESQYAWRF
jgi:hypothetical protein